jgi:hypothetical protein
MQNPFAAESRNLDAQAIVQKNAPDVAAKLRAAVTPPDTNPWAAETLNLSRQAEITRRDPARARSLKAAARMARD